MPSKFIRKTRFILKNVLNSIYFAVLTFNLKVLRAYQCDLCKSKELKVFSSYWRHPLLECKKCELKFIPGRTTVQKLKKLHGVKYWVDMYKHLGCSGNPAAWDEWKKWKKHLFTSLGVNFQSNSQRRKKILDIGCGNGALLEIFSEAGWECIGVDFSDFVKKNNFYSEISIINDSFENAKFLENNFDVISIIHTLEHFADPFFCLQKVKGILREEGTMVLELPLTQKYSGVHHRFFYNKRNIDLMLQKNGFETIKEITYKDEVHIEEDSENIILSCRKK